MTPEAASAMQAALRLLEEGAEFAPYAEALLWAHKAARPAFAMVQAGDHPRAMTWLRDTLANAEEPA
jgi:hypothetical protein